MEEKWTHTLKKKNLKKMANPNEEVPVDHAAEGEEVYEDATPPRAPLEATPILNIVSQPHGGLKIKEFNGQESWRLYSRQFARVAKMNGWGDAPLDYLWIHLAGEALAFAEGLPGAANLTYQQLCSELENRFGAERLSAVHKAELLSRKRRPGESLSELGQQIRTLVTFAHPKFQGEALEEMVLEKFLDALPSAELRKAIYQTNPQRLNDAVETGLQIEAWGLVEAKKHGKTMLRATSEAPQENEEYVRQLRDLQKQLQELKMQPKEKEKEEMKCYYCGKTGHVVRDCKIKARDQRSQRPQKGTRSSLTCYRCGGRGHRMGDCPTPQEN